MTYITSIVRADVHPDLGNDATLGIDMTRFVALLAMTLMMSADALYAGGQRDLISSLKASSYVSVTTQMSDATAESGGCEGSCD